MSALPGTLVGQQRHATDPASALTTAWGSPAIVLRCGVARPTALTPSSELAILNGISWLPEEVDHGYRFTTVGRTVYLEVTVPDHYSPEADAAVELSSTIAAQLPLVSPGPTAAATSS